MDAQLLIGFILGQGVGMYTLYRLALRRNGTPVSECQACAILKERVRVQEETMVLVLNTLHLFPGKFAR